MSRQTHVLNCDATKLTRRSFLRSSAVAAGVVGIALAGCAKQEEEPAEEPEAPEEAPAETDATSEAEPATEPADLPTEFMSGQPEVDGEQIFRGVCRPNCFAFCHVNVHVRDGKVVKTTRAPYNEECYSRVCQRGLSHVQRIYDPARVQYPMRRVGERGAGEWERVSWDEAFGEIAQHIADVQQEYGEQSVAFLTMSGNQSTGITSAYTRFRNVLSASQIAPCLDAASNFGEENLTGMTMNELLAYLMWNGNEPTDAKNAKTIMVWGANITDAQVQNWHLVKEAMQGGTKLVVIDPIYTQIASKADKWVSIRPAADTLLKFGIMRCIVERDALDREFLTQHTVAPFLVRTDTGAFLHASDMGIDPIDTGETDPTTGEPITVDPYVVLVNGEPTPLGEEPVGDIEGSADVNGIACRTAFELLKDAIMERTLDEISELTEVSVEDIEELADICIDGPVFHYEGYGPQAYNNGVHTTSAGLTMCALTGNLGKPGASYGAFWVIYLADTVMSPYCAPTGASTGYSIASVDFANVAKAGEFDGRPAPKFLWVYSANPINTNTDTHAWTDVIVPSLDYMVVADSILTDTAAYADMVLPIAQWFELEEVPNAGQTASMNYNEKAIEPLYESKTDTDIIAGVAAALGLGDLFTLDQSGVLEEVLNNDVSAASGMTLENLRAAQQIRMISGDAETDPYIAYRDGMFATPTGRLQFYREPASILPRAATTVTPTEEEIARECLPVFFPPLEAWPEGELAEKYPFVLMSERPRYRVHSQWCTTPLLREIDPEPTVKINPADAAANGINDGDYVDCFNDRGHAVAVAQLSEAIRPGTMVYPKSWQLSQHKAGGWSELSSTAFDVFGVNNNFMDVRCGIRLWDGEE